MEHITLEEHGYASRTYLQEKLLESQCCTVEFIPLSCCRRATTEVMQACMFTKKMRLLVPLPGPSSLSTSHCCDWTQWHKKLLFVWLHCFFRATLFWESYLFTYPCHPSSYESETTIQESSADCIAGTVWFYG